MIDVETGAVKNVVVIQSAGTADLDFATVTALRAWRFKLRTWKQADVPVRFSMRRDQANGSSGKTDVGTFPCATVRMSIGSGVEP
jgi:hypothetical protein